MICLSNAERAVLEKMYPEGCRVELEYMSPDPYSKLKPGDLGTVKFIDDAGQIHVSWDRGGSLALAYKEDKCKCIMKRDQMQEILEQVKKMPYESVEKMRDWIVNKLLPVFPGMDIAVSNNEMVVELGSGAFGVNKPKIPIRFTKDEQEHVFVKECGMREGEAVAMKVPGR